MVHPFFTTIAKNPNLANQCAKTASRSKKPSQSFTQVFIIFFPEDGELDNEVKSWLQAIADRFEFDNNNENQFTIMEVEKLFTRLGFNPKNSDTVKVFSFWLYLIWIYKMLMKEGYDRDDNIFGFMEGCSIQHVKVVLLGNNPNQGEPSSGYAFHESDCPSTEKLLDFVDSEIDLVCKHLDDYRFISMSEDQLNENKENCDLWGWIQQGVLLIHPRLTFEGNQDICEAWEIFTNFMLKYLSDKIGKVVFILLGLAVADKAALINQEKNLVMKLYHPVRYVLNPEHSLILNMDWESMLPFINANFYIWQRSEGDLENMIDWTNIEGVMKRKNRRLRQWNEFFCDVRKECGLIQRGSQKNFMDNIIVKRDMNGLLSIMIKSDD